MKNKILLLIILTLIVTGCEKETKSKYDTSNYKLNDIVESTDKIPDSSNNINPIEKPDNNNDEENNKPVTPTCVSKKFTKTFTYAYKTREECITNGASDTARIVNEYQDTTIYSYGCEPIRDECNELWYGVYYNSKDPVTNETIRKNY